MVKTRHEETRKRHHHEVSSSEDSDDLDGNDTPTHKSPRVNSLHSCVQSSAPAHHRDDEVSIPDGEEIKRPWKPFNGNLMTTTVAQMELMMGKMISRS